MNLQNDGEFMSILLNDGRREGKPPSFYTINGKILYKLAEIEDLESAKRQSN